ncbi:MAG: hypothetical protein ABIH23_12895 [bacterium]
MDGIRDYSLYQPTPITTLQKNLAGFYSKTSQLVKEKFDDVVQFGRSADETHSSVETQDTIREVKESKSGIPWLGRLIDIYA